MTNFDPVRMQLASGEPITQAVIAVVNQGIDSRLEGFTLSTLEWMAHYPSKIIPLPEVRRGDVALCAKLHCNIHPDELQILMRRLAELAERGVEDNMLYRGSEELLGWLLNSVFGERTRDE